MWSVTFLTDICLGPWASMGSLRDSGEIVIAVVFVIESNLADEVESRFQLPMSSAWSLHMCVCLDRIIRNPDSTTVLKVSGGIIFRSQGIRRKCSSVLSTEGPGLAMFWSYFRFMSFRAAPGLRLLLSCGKWNKVRVKS